MQRLFRFPSVWDLLLLLIGFIFLSILVSGALLLFWPGAMDLAPYISGRLAATGNEQLFLSRFMALAYALTVGLMVVFTLIYRRARGGTSKTLRFSMRGLNPTILLSGIVMIAAAGVVIEPLVEWLPQPNFDALGRGVWAILTLVVAAPILEEVLCRGIILESARARYGVLPALLISSLFFGMMHMQLAQSVGAFFIGLILGYIYIETNSIFAVVLLHALNNGVAYLLLMFNLDQTTLRSHFGSPTLYGVVYGVCLAVLVFAGWRIYRKCVLLQRCETVQE